jgi:hypothetical protein
MNIHAFTDLLTMVGASLSHLTGERWHVSEYATRENPMHAKLSGPNDAALWVNAQSYTAPGKLIISGHFPEHSLYNVGSHSIKVGASRGADVIAKEINRRLLPGYLADLDRVHERIAYTANSHEARLALATELAELIGGEVRDDDRHTETRAVTRGGRSIEARLSFTADAVYLKADVTPDEMRAIAAILNP